MDHGSDANQEINKHVNEFILKLAWRFDRWNKIENFTSGFIQRNV